MSTASNEGDRIPMSQQERDRLRVLHSVLDGERTQVEAARLLQLTPRQVRRLQQRLQQGGDAALVHGLRGQPSNHRMDAKLRSRVLRVYRKDYPDFGPTVAAEKLAERGLVVSPDTLRRWLLAEGLWQIQRRREQHRSRRPRRACFGELVQMDTSIHDWTEGRGEDMVLIHMIDDATSRLLAGSTMPTRWSTTSTCSSAGCRPTAAPWRCTPTGTASSRSTTRARLCPMRRRNSDERCAS